MRGASLRLRSLAFAALVFGGGLLPAVASDFDPESDLRVSQPVSVAAGELEVAFYSGYREGKITVSNRSEHPVRFTSYDGFVARIPPQEVFPVPCEGLAVSGILRILDEGGEVVRVDESPLCGDLVLVREGGHQ